MSGHTKYLENEVNKGQCADCKEKFPNEKTRVKSRFAMHAWRKRHQAKTNHTVRTAVTYVRRYDGARAEDDHTE